MKKNKREIKFRAWDKADREMYYNVQNDIDFDDGSCYSFRNFLGSQFQKERDCHKWELMQYTGLKDKNGVEIYEGDIIKNVEHSYPIEIKWFSNISCDDSNSSGYSIGSDDIVEVIGNIYEQPRNK